MTDKNNVEIKAGDIVEITGAYFKHDNALYFVEHIPGDPGWIGGDICLHMIGKSGKLSSAKYATAFWPLKAYVSNRVKAAQARIWNKEHAQIEVRTDIDQSFVAEWFRKAVNAYGWGFCEGLRDAFEAQKEEHQEWGLVMVTPQAVVEEADGLGKPRAIGRNEVDMDTLGARQKGYRDGLKFDPNSRLEGRPERAQLASCR